MKLKELLDKAGDFLDSKKSKESGKRKNLKNLMEKLEHKESKLEKDLKSASGSAKKKLRKDLAVVKAQIAKGKKILK